MKIILKTLLFYFCWLLISFCSKAQIGTGDDLGYDIQECNDGNFIIVGTTKNYGEGADDVYVIKTDSSGNLLWSKTFGTPWFEIGRKIQQCNDSTFIIVGETGVGGGVYLLKIDNNGNLLWSKSLVINGFEVGRDVRQCSDGGFIIAGSTYGFTTNLFDFDAFLMKTDSVGDIQWATIFGSDNADYGYSVDQCNDGGFILTGVTFTGYDTVIVGPKDPIILLVKTDANGNLQWSKTYTENNNDNAYSVQQTSDGGFILTGFGYSGFTGRISLVKTDESGDVLWAKGLYKGDDPYPFSVQECNDQGFIITGYTDLSGGGNKDLYLLKTDKYGSLLWSKTFGGNGDDLGYSARQTSDGGFVITGWTKSFGGGNAHVYVLKTDSMGDLEWSKTFGDVSGKRGSSVQKNASNLPITLWDVEESLNLPRETSELFNNYSQIHQSKLYKNLDTSCYKDITSSVITLVPSTIVGTPHDSLSDAATSTSSGGTTIFIPNFVDSKFCPSSVGIADVIYNNGLYLYPNYPNPFQNTTTIEYNIPKTAQKVEILIYDIISKNVIQSLILKDNDNRKVEFQANNLLNGIYLYSLKVDGIVVGTQKMLIFR